MKKFKNLASNCVVGALLVLLIAAEGISAKRIFSGSSRKSSSSGSGSRVTPSYSSSGSSNSHADVAKLSYPNYNAQPNRPAAAPASSGNQQPPPYGWNAPKQQGPPPAYSPNNPAGGAKTNLHEAPPAYHAPPGYGNNYAAPPPGATYHAPGHIPAGATYYPSAGHAPGGYGAPGGYHPGPGQLPAGATYVQAGGALPPGATYYAQPPQSSSSGLGFGTGLIAGGLGGALLGHALTPTHTQSVAAAPAAADGGHDRIIIINNGQPVNVTESGSGTTVINAAGAPMQNNTESTAPLAPMPPMAPMASMPAPDAINGTSADTNVTNPATAEQSQPPAGGIICVPVRVNDTDPTDSSKMIEVEKIACYPAPPPPPPQQQQSDPNAPQVPLAPMQPVPGQSAQQQETLLPNDAAVRAASSVNNAKPQFGIVGYALVALIYLCRMH